MDLYIGAALLALMAVGLVSWPWLRMRVATAKRVHTLSNVEVIRQRLLELELEQQQSLLSEQDKQQSIDELKLALLDEQQSAQYRQGSAKLPLVIGAVLAIAVSGWTYFSANEIAAIEHWKQARADVSALGKRVVAADETLNGEDMQDFALGLRSQLHDKPDDAQGWWLLGRIFTVNNRLDSAFEAYQKSLQIKPDSSLTLTSYAQSLMMTGQSEYLQWAQGLLLRAVALVPDDIDSLGMLAVTATELGNIDLAIDSWQRLQSHLSSSDPIYARVAERIANLKSEQTTTDDASKEVNHEPGVPQSGIQISVNISDELKGKLPQQGYLFVFAQNAESELRMPAAVIRIPLGNLPLVVILSDKNAMVPGYTLSSLNKARLVARISQDEDVNVSSGELQGDVVVDVKAASQQSQSNVVQTIIIDQEIL